MKTFDHIIFLHIPKAAGNTVRSVAYRNYATNAVLSMPRHISVGIDAFKQLNPEKLAGIRFMRGHMMYGLHESFPGKATYMTFLREPVDRVASLWRFIRGNPNHTLHEPVKKMAGITEFLESRITPEIHNVQTVSISGKAVDSFDCGEEDFQKAEKHLRNHFSTVGLVEEFDRSLALCCVVYGWKNPTWSRLNVSKSRIPTQSLAPAELEAVRHHNQYDMQLYELARELFQNQSHQHADAIENVLQSTSTNSPLIRVRKKILNLTDAYRNNQIHKHSRLLLGL